MIKLTTSLKKPFLNSLKYCYTKVLTLNGLDQKIRDAKYAVRGPILIKAQQYDLELQAGKVFPFDKITQLNIGNPQQLGQPPIQYPREVMACLLDPSLINKQVYSTDVCNRAQSMLKDVQSLGAYSESQGIRSVRQAVIDFIKKRDGFESQIESIFLGNGAGSMISTTLALLLHKPMARDGILIPVPRYPLYSAEITLQGGVSCPYYLNEEREWGLEISELQSSYDKAVEAGVRPKAMVVINPGNPTGSVLQKQNIHRIIQFCYEKNLMILADEVYQANIYSPQKAFHSFKKVLMEMDGEIKNNLELASYHSISKGMHGECGLRGGYVELTNVLDEVKSEFLKLQSIQLCSSTIGQVMVGLMCSPPIQPSSTKATVEQYNMQVQGHLDSLKRRARMVTESLRQMKNISVIDVEGAMYAFPSIAFSDKAIQAARNAKQQPDEFYCFQAMEQTGIVLVPGSGFGQKEGTHHFRITILMYQEKEFQKVMKSLYNFNQNFHNKY